MRAGRPASSAASARPLGMLSPDSVGPGVEDAGLPVCPADLTRPSPRPASRPRPLVCVSGHARAGEKVAQNGRHGEEHSGNGVTVRGPGREPLSHLRAGRTGFGTGSRWWRCGKVTEPPSWWHTQEHTQSLADGGCSHRPAGRKEDPRRLLQHQPVREHTDGQEPRAIHVPKGAWDTGGPCNRTRTCPRPRSSCRLPWDSHEEGSFPDT